MIRNCVLEATPPAIEPHFLYGPSCIWSRPEIASSTLSLTISKFGISETQSKDALFSRSDLNKYDAATHFVGQSTIVTLTNERATGEAYCLAHHVTVDGEKRRLMLASLRYQDTFVKMDGAWLFAERLLYVDWLEERALS
jgi:hypothetical protein